MSGSSTMVAERPGEGADGAVSPRICDYEGSPYRRVFWEDADRAFEDLAERRALAHLLPPRGGRLVEIGAGFGRLIDLYRGYETVFLLDYARSMLEDARARIGEGAVYVCADLYRLPFATSTLDTIVQVRVLHHVEDVQAALGEVARVLATGGSYVLEFANKRNAKALARWALGRQDENPLDERPWEFVPLNWNFHPRHVDRALAEAGLEVRDRRAVSLLRHPDLKSRVPATTLARLDAALGAVAAWAAPGPSQMVRAARLRGGPLRPMAWRCPACGHEPLRAAADHVPCPACGRDWPIENGIHIFR